MEKTGEEYIWHCPSEECAKNGVILLKTGIPWLGRGKIKCSKCGQIYNFGMIMKSNIRNLERCIRGLKT